jgi:hypothetical protein
MDETGTNCAQLASEEKENVVTSATGGARSFLPSARSRWRSRAVLGWSIARVYGQDRRHESAEAADWVIGLTRQKIKGPTCRSWPVAEVVNLHPTRAYVVIRRLRRIIIRRELRWKKAQGKATRLHLRDQLFPRLDYVAVRRYRLDPRVRRCESPRSFLCDGGALLCSPSPLAVLAMRRIKSLIFKIFLDFGLVFAHYFIGLGEKFPSPPGHNVR